jgi:hypothetical protein
MPWGRDELTRDRPAELERCGRSPGLEPQRHGRGERTRTLGVGQVCRCQEKAGDQVGKLESHTCSRRMVNDTAHGACARRDSARWRARRLDGKLRRAL